MPRSRQSATFNVHGRWSIVDARAAIAAHAASGLSASAFAMREGLDVQRLYRWRRRLARERMARLAFVEVQPRRPEPIEIVMRSGRIVRVSESVDGAALARIIDALDKV